jgi:hypothetical protein
MKALIVTLPLLLMAPTFALAQDSAHPYRGQAYAFFGFGTATPGSPLFEYLGGGAEGFLYKGLGFGGEVDYANAGSGAQVYTGHAWIGSADFSYHFGRHVARGKADPFVIGGFSVVGSTEQGAGYGTPAANFGAGANWWLAEHAALRFEFRDVVGARFWPYQNAFSFRIGVTFR